MSFVAQSRAAKLLAQIVSALHSTTGGDGGLPVLPLLEIIVAYALPVPYVTTVARSQRGEIVDCTLWRHPDTARPYLLVADYARGLWSIDIEAGTPLPSFPVPHASQQLSETKGSRELAVFDAASAVAVHPHDRTTYVSAFFRIGTSPDTYLRPLFRVVRPSGEVVPALYGRDGVTPVDGTGSSEYSESSGITLSSDGAFLLLCNAGLSVVERLSLPPKAGERPIPVAGDGTDAHSDGPALWSYINSPHCGVFDRTTTVRDSVYYIAAEDSIRILNLQTNELSTLKLSRALNARGIVFVTPNLLLVSESRSGFLFTVDKRTGDVQWFAGVEQPPSVAAIPPPARLADAYFFRPAGLCVVPASTPADEFDSCVYVADWMYLRRIGLPADWAPHPPV